MQPGSCFDGRHLYCERMHAWTNLLSPEWRGQCFFDAEQKQLILDFTDGDDGADDADESQPQPR